MGGIALVQSLALVVPSRTTAPVPSPGRMGNRPRRADRDVSAAVGGEHVLRGGAEPGRESLFQLGGAARVGGGVEAVDLLRRPRARSSASTASCAPTRRIGPRWVKYERVGGDRLAARSDDSARSAARPASTRHPAGTAPDASASSTCSAYRSSTSAPVLVKVHATSRLKPMMMAAEPGIVTPYTSSAPGTTRCASYQMDGSVRSRCGSPASSACPLAGAAATPPSCCSPSTGGSSPSMRASRAAGQEGSRRREQPRAAAVGRAGRRQRPCVEVRRALAVRLDRLLDRLIVRERAPRPRAAPTRDAAAARSSSTARYASVQPIRLKRWYESASVHSAGARAGEAELERQLARGQLRARTH